MALLHLLHALATKRRWKLFVAHFNHQLRGRSSDADERLVRRTAQSLGLKFFSGRAAVKTYARQRKQSIEMAARQLRHEFFARTAAKLNCRTIALAHHADDQVELFFLRLLRGAGGEGLAGMKWANASPADKSIRLVRPLLDLNKATLAKFVRSKKIAFREDVSNASLAIFRNRIRHKLLPLLRREFQPALESIILRVAEIVGDEAGFVEMAANGWRPSGRVAFAKQPVALQRRILQKQLLRHGITPDFGLVESLWASANKFQTIGTNQMVCRDANGRLIVRRDIPNAFGKRTTSVRLKGRAGRGTFGKLRFNWRVASRPGAKLSRQFNGFEAFDADKIGARIVLRHWRPGDRFQPIGMASSVKLQDLFVNRKIPRAQRHEMALAANGDGEIFWVEGQRISEKFKLTPGTQRRLIWRWRRG